MAALELSAFSHVTQFVTDIEQSMDFYKRVLGLKELFIAELPDDMGFWSGVLTNAGVSIELWQLTGAKGKPSPVPTSSQCTRLVFSVLDFETAKFVPAEEGIDVSQEMEFEGTKMVFIQDPYGRTIEIAQFPNGDTSVAKMHGH
jgi:catechol 2,3-dioxygenase-like lactoylglutathione lyase family enzyme